MSGQAQITDGKQRKWISESRSPLIQKHGADYSAP